MLHATRYTLHATHYTLHTTHYTLHDTHYTLHTAQHNTIQHDTTKYNTMLTNNAPSNMARYQTISIQHLHIAPRIWYDIFGVTSIGDFAAGSWALGPTTPGKTNAKDPGMGSLTDRAS